MASSMQRNLEFRNEISRELEEEFTNGSGACLVFFSANLLFGGIFHFNTYSMNT